MALENGAGVKRDGRGNNNMFQKQRRVAEDVSLFLHAPPSVNIHLLFFVVRSNVNCSKCLI